MLVTQPRGGYAPPHAEIVEQESGVCGDESEELYDVGDLRCSRGRGLSELDRVKSVLRVPFTPCTDHRSESATTDRKYHSWYC